MTFLSHVTCVDQSDEPYRPQVVEDQLQYTCSDLEVKR